MASGLQKQDACLSQGDQIRVGTRAMLADQSTRCRFQVVHFRPNLTTLELHALLRVGRRRRDAADDAYGLAVDVFFPFVGRVERK